MKTSLLLTIILILMSFTLQGCGGLVVSKAFETAGIGVDSYPITLDNTITLEGENTPLSSIPSLRICVTKFKDDRDMSNEQKIGMKRTYSKWIPLTFAFDSSTIVVTNIESVSSLVTKSISNELKRNKHNVVTDEQSCDYVISGTIKEYRLTAPPLGIMTKKCRGTISVDIAIQRKGCNRTIFSKNFPLSCLS